MLAKDKGQEGEGVGVGWCVACGLANAYSVWILGDGLVGWFVYVSVFKTSPRLHLAVLICFLYFRCSFVSPFCLFVLVLHNLTRSGSGSHFPIFHFHHDDKTTIKCGTVLTKIESEN